MRVLVINPNATAAMTAHVARQLRPCLPANAVIIEKTAASGPAVIATAQAFSIGAQAATAALAEAISEGAGFDRVLLACFGDPGLEELQALTTVPVTGLAQACMRHAETAGQPYAVVTAGAGWKPILDQRFERWGASGLYCGTHVIGATGLEVFSDPMGVLPFMLAGIGAARRAGAHRIILGGVVMAGYRELMAQSGALTQGLVDCVEDAAQELLLP